MPGLPLGLQASSVDGELSIYMHYTPADSAARTTKKSKIAGQLNVTINEARALNTSEPYVKMSVSLVRLCSPAHLVPYAGRLYLGSSCHPVVMCTPIFLRRQCRGRAPRHAHTSHPHMPAPCTRPPARPRLTHAHCRGDGNGYLANTTTTTTTNTSRRYLSKNGSNVKNTKQKTKTQKGTKNPLFNQSFVFNVTKDMSIEDDSTRIQIMVWDHARARANECMGGMSFTIKEIASSALRIRGWFPLLPYKEGRTRHVKQQQQTAMSSSPLVARKETDVRAPAEPAPQVASQAGPGKGMQRTTLSSMGSARSPTSTPMAPRQKAAALGVAAAGGLAVGSSVDALTAGSASPKTRVKMPSSGKLSKKDAGILHQQLQDAEEREERHISEKASMLQHHPRPCQCTRLLRCCSACPWRCHALPAVLPAVFLTGDGGGRGAGVLWAQAELHNKVQQLREQLQGSTAAQTRNLALQNELADAAAELAKKEEELKGKDTEKEDVEDSLQTEIRRLNDQVILLNEDSSRHRDQIMILRDSLSDQRDENDGLRKFIGMLQMELLSANPKAFERVVNQYSEMLN